MKRIVLVTALALVAMTPGSSIAQAPPPAQPPAETKKPPAVLTEITDATPLENGDGVQITIAAGTKLGVAVGWTGVALDSNGKPIRGSEFKVLKTTKNASVARLKIAADQLAPNNPVRLAPP